MAKVKVTQAEYDRLLSQYKELWTRCSTAESLNVELKKKNGIPPNRPKQRGRADSMTLRQTGGGFGYGAFAEGADSIIYEVLLPNIYLSSMARAFWHHDFIIGLVGACTTAICVFIWKVSNRYG